MLNGVAAVAAEIVWNTAALRKHLPCFPFTPRREKSYANASNRNQIQCVISICSRAKDPRVRMCPHSSLGIAWFFWPRCQKSAARDLRSTRAGARREGAQGCWQWGGVGMSRSTQAPSRAALPAWPEVKSPLCPAQGCWAGSAKGNGERGCPGMASGPVMATEQGSGGAKSRAHSRPD